MAQVVNAELVRNLSSFFPFNGEVIKPINVKNKVFGAIGDGVTDDSSAIQTAYDVSNGVIYFPRGSYLCSSAITDGAVTVVKAGTTLDFSDGGGWLVGTDGGGGSVTGPTYYAHNFHTSGLVYGVYIDTDTDNADRAAGLAITNRGKSDNIYLSVSGKPGPAASSPTGIGIDLNVAAGSSGESSASNTGTGILMFDHSTTDQGVNGPHMISLQKTGNLNTEHPALEINANRNAIRLIADPSVGGFNGGWPWVSAYRQDTGAEYWRMMPDGNFLFVTDTKGILFNFSSGNQGALKWNDAGPTVDLIGGSSGIRVLNNASSLVNFRFTDYAAIRWRIRTSAPGSPADGDICLADGTSWNPGSGKGLYRYDGTNWNFLG